MERSKGLILLVVGLAAALIVWQVGFNKSETQTPVKEKEPVTTSQPAAGTASRQNERIAANPQGRNTAEANPNMRNQERGDNNFNRTRTTQPNIQNTGYKIAIPTDISSADLQIIYNEYLRFGGRNRTRGGNRGGMMESFGGMGGGRGGMMEGGMMGGGMMGGYGGMGEMGGMMGGMGDMGAMMEQFGGMGGFGGGMGMEMGMAPGGMEMGGNDQMNIDDIDDSENNF